MLWFAFTLVCYICSFHVQKLNVCLIIFVLNQRSAGSEACLFQREEKNASFFILDHAHFILSSEWIWNCVYTDVKL